MLRHSIRSVLNIQRRCLAIPAAKTNPEVLYTGVSWVTFRNNFYSGAKFELQTFMTFDDLETACAMRYPLKTKVVAMVHWRDYFHFSFSSTTSGIRRGAAKLSTLSTQLTSRSLPKCRNRPRLTSIKPSQLRNWRSSWARHGDEWTPASVEICWTNWPTSWNVTAFTSP